jgi:hypothetical protein
MQWLFIRRQLAWGERAIGTYRFLQVLLSVLHVEGVLHQELAQPQTGCCLVRGQHGLAEHGYVALNSLQGMPICC